MPLPNTSESVEAGVVEVLVKTSVPAPEVVVEETPEQAAATMAKATTDNCTVTSVRRMIGASVESLFKPETPVYAVSVGDDGSLSMSMPYACAVSSAVAASPTAPIATM